MTTVELNFSEIARKEPSYLTKAVALQNRKVYNDSSKHFQFKQKIIKIVLMQKTSMYKFVNW